MECRLNSKLRTEPGGGDRPEPSAEDVAWPPGGLSGVRPQVWLQGEGPDDSHQLVGKVKISARDKKASHHDPTAATIASKLTSSEDTQFCVCVCVYERKIVSSVRSFSIQKTKIY